MVHTARNSRLLDYCGLKRRAKPSWFAAEDLNGVVLFLLARSNLSCNIEKGSQPGKSLDIIDCSIVDATRNRRMNQVRGGEGFA
jgi:hypothetical protein